MNNIKEDVFARHPLLVFINNAKKKSKSYDLDFLVEVAGLELAASSTRNWRATSCATPRY